MEQEKLKVFNSNIIKWYPFEKERDNNILQIGINEEITKELQSKFKNVDIIELNKNEDLELKKESNIKYDYILIYGYQNYDDIIKELIPLTNESTKILIIFENKFGINNWSKYYKENSDYGIMRNTRWRRSNKNIKKCKRWIKWKWIYMSKYILCFSKL